MSSSDAIRKARSLVIFDSRRVGNAPVEHLRRSGKIGQDITGRCRRPSPRSQSPARHLPSTAPSESCRKQRLPGPTVTVPAVESILLREGGGHLLRVGRKHLLGGNLLDGL